jgi:hypothetical protein
METFDHSVRRNCSFYYFHSFFITEVSYPEDVYISQEVPSDAATAVQPEAVVIPPAVVPQVDRTRKPMNNQKPESPVIEQQELPIKPVRI